MSMQRIAYKVHGTVQGVGFRDFTQKRATHHGLKGFVKNTLCGRVEGEAQGTTESLQKWLAEINKGPPMSHVVKVEKRELDVRDGEDHFGVKRTSESAFNAE